MGVVKVASIRTLLARPLSYITSIPAIDLQGRCYHPILQMGEGCTGFKCGCLRLQGSLTCLKRHIGGEAPASLWDGGPWSRLKEPTPPWKNVGCLSVS